jgi:hypothetical protein
MLRRQEANSPGASRRNEPGREWVKKRMPTSMKWSVAFPHSAPTITGQQRVCYGMLTYLSSQVQAARERARTNGNNVKDFAKEGIDKIDQIRHDTAKNLGTTVDKLDRKVEEKASEAKKSVSGWFGGGK